MENYNYYTPESEEFYTEFEVEIKEKDIWIPHILNKGDIVGIFYYKTLHKNNIRVKYLDPSDIESLGWVKDNTNCSYKLGDYYLQVPNINHNHILRIYTTHIKGTFDNQIWLTIKNKSELKKLMKQLNIKLSDTQVLIK